VRNGNMRRFTALYLALDATTKTLAKQQALEAYFRTVPAQDAAWSTFFLTGRKLKRLVRARDLRDAALEAAAIEPRCNAQLTMHRLPLPFLRLARLAGTRNPAIIQRSQARSSAG
jgi:hypothetical protein